MRVTGLYISALFWFIGLSGYGQITVTPTNNAALLVEELVGPGVIVSNEQLFSSAIGQGIFTGNGGSMGFDNGIVLTSGRAVDAEGPNSQVFPNATSFVTGQPGDPLLTQAAGAPTQDRCELRFDVIPLSDTLTFRYVFASEEYPEYVCSGFNDVFGFYVSGPNPQGGNYNNQNVAIIPGSSLPVAINTVNPGVAGSQGTPNGCVSLAYSAFYVSNNVQGQGTIEYDGHTIVLRALIPVVKCQTYTLRLMVADAGDGLWDSGVFLESGSLQSNAATVEAISNGGIGYSNLIEGCLDGELIFRRGNSGSNPLTIYINKAGTATNGIDYVAIPDSVIIPPNQDSVVIDLIAFQDNLAEPFESLIIYISIGCNNEIADSAVIFITDSLSISITPDTTICLGQSIQLQAVGGGNFNWSPPTGLNVTFISTPTATPLVTTTYTVSSSIAACSATNQVTISVVDYPNINAGPDTSVCRGNSLTMVATGAAQTYSWTPVQFMNNPTILNPTVVPLATTSYVLTASNGNGLCVRKDTVNVTVNLPPNINAGSNRNICAGDSVQLTATGGVSYVWSPAATVSDPNIPNPFVFPSSPTIYTVIGTDANGCSREDQVLVSIIPAPNVSAGNDVTICAGASTTLSAGGGSTYSWLPAATLSNPTIRNPIATPVTTTTYTVTGTNPAGCTNTDTVRVTVNLPPIPNPQANTLQVCPGETINLSASGGITYQWSPPAGLSNPGIANPVATVTAPVTYTVTVTDAAGCVGIDSISLTVFQPPVISTGGNDSICVGESITLSASGGLLYQWSPSATLSNPSISNPVATPANTTTYSLTVQDANGCTSDGQVTVTVMPRPIVNAGIDQNVCQGSAVNLNASGAFSYSWAPSQGISNPSIGNPTLVPQQNQTYTVTGATAFGCTANDTVRITVIPLPATTVGGAPTGVCPGGQIQLTATGGIGYQWSPASGLSNPNIANPTASPAATTMYTVRITDITGCVATDSILATIYSLPNLSAGADDTLCAGQSVTLQGTGALTYAWLPATGLSNPAVRNPVATPATTTNYTLTGTDANGCTNTDEITIRVNPLPIANAGADVTECRNTVANLAGSGGVSYQWSPSSGLSCTNCPNPALVVNGSRNYVLRVTDVNGCTDTDTIAVTMLALPAVNAGVDQTICPGTAATLSGAAAGSTFSWSPPAGLSSTIVLDPTANPATATTYTLTTTDGNGCVNRDSVRIDFFPNSQIVTGTDTAICIGRSVRLQASTMVSYTWQPGTSLSNANVANPWATPTVTTVYTVTGTDANGCVSTATQRVTVNPLPALNPAFTDTTICPGTSVTLQVASGFTYVWTPATYLSNPGIANPVATPTGAVSYTVTATNNFNCSSNAVIDVDVYPVTDPNAGPANAGICPGDAIQLTAQGGVSYDWSPRSSLDNRNAATPFASPSATTQYTVVIQDINGCTFSDTVSVTVYPAAWSEAGDDQSVFIGNSVILEGSGNGAYNWTPDKWLSDATIANPVATPDSSTTYTLTITTPDGCTAQDSVYIRVYYPTEMYMPNAFTPNGDGNNDLFGPVWFNEFELVYFRIFNRWGQLVYETNDPTAWWNGTANGVPQPMDTYVYMIRGVGNRGENFVQEGNVVLLR